MHILNHILDLANLNKMKLTLEQYMLSVLHSQYHACWCTGDFRSQCISRHGIDTQSQNILSPLSEELIRQGSGSQNMDHYQQENIWKLWDKIFTAMN